MSNKTLSQPGHLVCVGVGMTLGSHISPLSRSFIEQADVVFAMVSDSIVEFWLQQMHPDVRSLQPYYKTGQSRKITYQQMVAVMIAEVRAGKRVCGAFYGHPGVFACVPHRAITLARKEGYSAHMQPGISAEDCLIADLGVDPGKVGCQQYEASQFMFYKRRIDPSAYLILWQIGVAGDLSASKTSTGSAFREILVELLQEYYPKNHCITIYEAATLAIYEPRIEEMTLQQFINAEIHPHTTMLIPPAKALTPNQDIVNRISNLAIGA